MKRILLFLAAILLTFNSFAQKAPKYTEEDAMHFYRTLQGDYTVLVNDSTTATVHITPIWEHTGNPYQWLYVEVTMAENVILQKVIEVKPKDDKIEIGRASCRERV